MKKGVHWNVFPKVINKQQNMLNFTSEYKNSVKNGKMKLGSQWSGGDVFSFGKARAASFGNI